VELLKGLDCLIVQDIFMTKTAELADVVLPASNSAFESEGTVTNSERRVQRVRKALDPPGNARDDIWIITRLAERLGRDWGELTPPRRVAGAQIAQPHARRDVVRAPRRAGRDPVAVPRRDPPGHAVPHARLWADDPAEQGPKAPFSIVVDDPPVDTLTDEFPLRLTTGRRLDSYNTGVQTGGYTSPLRRRETIDVSPEDAERMALAEGEVVAISSRRGTVEAPVHVDHALRPGLVFMTFHFPDQVDTNVLTIEATDPKSGTAEFKASAVRIDKLPAPVAGGSA